MGKREKYCHHRHYQSHYCCDHRCDYMQSNMIFVTGTTGIVRVKLSRLNAKTAYLTLVYGIFKLFLGVGKGNALMTIIRYVCSADHYDHGKRGHG